MAIIGKLIKKTTKYSYTRNAKKGVEYKHQIETLKSLLESAKNTKFGFVHSFHNILSRVDSVTYFQKNIPITDYDTFYKSWLEDTINGAENNTWKGKIKYFALSSGTTGSPSKRIPITPEMIRSFQKISLRQLSVLHELDLPESFYGSSILTVGGSTKLNKVGKHIEGDLSGILRKHTSLVATPFTQPGKRITDIKTWDEKLDAIIQKAPLWNIGIIAGIPSWCILLIEKIKEHYKLESIHEIWPNLNVYVHGGVFMAPYINRFEKLGTKKIKLLDTYLASEGYFAYQTSPSKKGMKLLLNCGIFYEFIPFNSDYFDENGKLIDNNDALTISQVKEGVDYALVISTNAGLWRYLIGDLVRFLDIKEHELIITGRIKQFLSLCGEHLSLDNINQALISLSEELSVHIDEFTIFADEEEQRHSWFLGTNKEVNAEEVMNFIDNKLSNLNDDYAYVRKYNLKSPKVHFVEPTLFYNFLASLGKTGGQNKMPRVLSKDQAVLWNNFIKNNI